MKVILLVDDKKLGKKNSITEVSDSYARNVLIPKKIVIQATEANLRILDAKLAQEKRDREALIEQAAETSKKISELKSVVIPVKCFKDGKMFGSVTTRDVADILADKGITVSKQEIELSSTIRSTGTYLSVIKLFGGIVAKLAIVVTEE